MDESTISDIRERIARWAKEGQQERHWIFAVNIDDVELMLATIARLEVDNEALRLQHFAARDHQWVMGVDYACPDCDKSRFVLMDGEALEPPPCTGEPAYWFEINTGPYIANDIPQQRAHRFSRGPFATREEADSKWREYLKEQKAQRKP